MVGKILLCLFSAVFAWAVFVEASYMSVPRPIAFVMGVAVFIGIAWVLVSEKRDGPAN